MQSLGQNELDNRLASVIYTLPNICKQAELCTCHQLLHGVHLRPPPHPHQSFIPYLIFVYKQGDAHVISFSKGLTTTPSPPPSVIYTLPNICIQAELCTCHHLRLLHGVDPPPPPHPHQSFIPLKKEQG